jgi:hypothetical protein
VGQSDRSEEGAKEHYSNKEASHSREQMVKRKRKTDATNEHTADTRRKRSNL